MQLDKWCGPKDTMREGMVMQRQGGMPAAVLFNADLEQPAQNGQANGKPAQMEMAKTRA